MTQDIDPLAALYETTFKRPWADHTEDELELLVAALQARLDQLNAQLRDAGMAAS